MSSIVNYTANNITVLAQNKGNHIETVHENNKNVRITNQSILHLIVLVEQ